MIQAVLQHTRIRWKDWWPFTNNISYKYTRCIPRKLLQKSHQLVHLKYKYIQTWGIPRVNTDKNHQQAKHLFVENKHLCLNHMAMQRPRIYLNVYLPNPISTLV